MGESRGTHISCESKQRGGGARGVYTRGCSQGGAKYTVAEARGFTFDVNQSRRDMRMLG